MSADPVKDAIGLKPDSEWVLSTFMLSTAHLPAKVQEWRLHTRAKQKFTDTRLGGNFAINPLPSYTESCDIKSKGLDGRVSNSGRTYLGMGDFYSEQIDDNQQLIMMSFGVPEYNGMISFFTGFFNNDAALLANEGRGSVSYYIGRAAGFVISMSVVMAFPVLLGFWVARLLLFRPSSSYYRFKETMPLFWNRCNFIANQIGVNMGIVPRIYNSKTGDSIEDTKLDQNEKYIDYAHRNGDPDIYRKGGGIDIYAVATRAQRMSNVRYSELIALEGKDNDPTSMAQAMKTWMYKRIMDPWPEQRIEDYLDAYHRSALGDKTNLRDNPIAAKINTDVSELQAAETPPGSEAPAAEQTPNYGATPLRDRYIPNTTGDGEEKSQEGYGRKPGMLDYYKAQQQDGSRWIGYRVNYEPNIEESFSNSTDTPQIANTFNGASGGARELNFTLSGGQTGLGIVDSAVTAVKDMFKGAVDSVGMSGLMALAGGGFVDIPKHWSSSSSSFPSASFTIELRSWAGNKQARFQNIMIPLATLLAAALPISTGRHSYTSPFLCQLFSRGRQQIKLGMITSLRITRGTGEMGWSRNNEVLGIDVTFEVSDMSSIMHVPIDNGSPGLKAAAQVVGGVGGAIAGGAVAGPYGAVLAGAAGAQGAGFVAEGVSKVIDGIFTDENPFMDYMAVLGNLSTADQIYRSRKLFLNLTRAYQAFDTHFTKAHFASSLDEGGPSRIVGHAFGIFTRNNNSLVVN